MNFKAMGSPCSISLYCARQAQFERVAELCVSEALRLEAKYSRYLRTSLLSRINAAAGSEQRFKLDEEFVALLMYAETAYKISDGFFDVTSGVLSRVWNFSEQLVPKTAEIAQTLTLVGWLKLTDSRDNFYLPQKGMAIDFGAIVKEYAADLLAQLARDNKIKHGLIDLAGDLAVVGPHPGNSPWQIAIKNPQSPHQAIVTIPLMSGGLASSSDYERFIVLNGEKHSHILDPNTGWPVKGLASVSVWAPQCIVAGTMATTAMLMGQVPGLHWLDINQCQYVAVDQQMKVTMQG